MIQSLTWRLWACVALLSLPAFLAAALAGARAVEATLEDARAARLSIVLSHVGRAVEKSLDAGRGLREMDDINRRLGAMLRSAEDLQSVHVLADGRDGVETALGAGPPLPVGPRGEIMDGVRAGETGPWAPTVDGGTIRALPLIGPDGTPVAALVTWAAAPPDPDRAILGRALAIGVGAWVAFAALAAVVFNAAFARVGRRIASMREALESVRVGLGAPPPAPALSSSAWEAEQACARLVRDVGPGAVAMGLVTVYLGGPGALPAEPVARSDGGGRDGH